MTFHTSIWLQNYIKYVPVFRKLTFWKSIGYKTHEVGDFFSKVKPKTGSHT
jgi:hypothetical protein